MRALAALMVLALSALVGLGAATPFATTADVNAKQDASTNLTAVAAGGGIAANWQASGTNSVSIGNATVVSQHGYSGYAVANLPTGVAAGYQTYCTDCITPWGTGDRVEWDGTAWTTLRQRVSATTSVLDYILSCVTNEVNVNTKRSDIRLSSKSLTQGVYEFPRASAVNSGLITLQTTAMTEPIGSIMGFVTSSGQTAGPLSIGPYTPVVAGGYYASGGSYAVDAAPNGTDNFFDVVGLTTTVTTNYPVTGAYFLYDRYQSYAVSNATCSATWTNNWLAVTALSSQYNLTDTRLPVTTSTTAPNRLAVIVTSTAVYFMTNGVLSVTDSGVTIPGTTSLFLGRTSRLKTLGSQSKILYEASPWYHVRRAADRTF